MSDIWKRVTWELISSIFMAVMKIILNNHDWCSSMNMTFKVVRSSVSQSLMICISTSLLNIYPLHFLLNCPDDALTFVTRCWCFCPWLQLTTNNLSATAKLIFWYIVQANEHLLYSSDIWIFNYQIAVSLTDFLDNDIR